MKNEILKAMKADAIPAGESGLWTIKKWSFNKPMIAPRAGKLVEIPPGNYTCLMRLTTATMMNGGELVMHDVPAELNTHLNFAMRAFGKVLITGLGLGCIARGVLANPKVKKVVVVENSQDVIKLVAPHMDRMAGKLTIVTDDAREFVKRSRAKFDCAWHDLWTDEENGQEHLQLVHNELICELADK